MHATVTLPKSVRQYLRAIDDAVRFQDRDRTRSVHARRDASRLLDSMDSEVSRLALSIRDLNGTI